jgi:hypothetical protein
MTSAGWPNLADDILQNDQIIEVLFGDGGGVAPLNARARIRRGRTK